MKLFRLLYTLVLFALTFHLNGQDFVYKPINPAFGGDTFNYNWLLSSAQEQNQFTETSQLTPFGTSLEDFEENINRQILNLLSRQLVGNAFGDGGFEDGLYTIGSFEIEVTSGVSGINIYLLNTTDGSETSIVVPYY
ncbi:MAG: curli production assembly/transport component CsgF [Flavobacteriaceae bacterium]|nr:curli production assembly/transport component CsgF [Flavobacteriaceae bacterium]